MNDCLVIIPAYNEGKNIGRVLQEVTRLDQSLDVLVVNDGSTDRTEEVVRENGVNIINLPYNLGYGGACQTGFKYAAAAGYRYIIQFDADGQHDPKDIITILDRLEKGNYDIVIGSRFLGRGTYKIGWLKCIAISIFRFIIKITTGEKITDPSSGLQGLSKRAFSFYAGMGYYPPDYPDADILIYMIKCNYRVTEFSANIKQRLSGKSMHSGIKPLFYLIKMIVSILVVLLRGKIKVEGVDNG